MVPHVSFREPGESTRDEGEDAREGEYLFEALILENRSTLLLRRAQADRQAIPQETDL
jgi:hypothetical protein